MASLCKFKLGIGNVDLQMVSSYHPTESEKQYAVYVSDQHLHWTDVTETDAWRSVTWTQITGTILGLS